MNPVTEEDIRAAIAREWHGRPPSGESMANEFDDMFTRLTGLTLFGGIWDDQVIPNPATDRLLELTTSVIDPIRDRVRAEVVEALVTATLRFAAEHPDVPRAERAVSA
jgi:hypothetical protein